MKRYQVDLNRIEFGKWRRTVKMVLISIKLNR